MSTIDKNFRVKHGINVGSEGITFSDGTTILTASGVGSTGPTGPAGANGLPGADGLPGPTGPAGADGLSGADGLPGPTGPAGADGLPGAEGPTGPQGEVGPTGANGGLGATELFARNSLPTGVAGQVITISNSGSDTNAPAGNYALAYWDADTSEWIYVGNSNSVTPIDDIAPTISISSDQTSLGANETATITFYLSEASQNFGNSAIDVIGGIIGYTDKSGNTYTATFTPDSNSSGTAYIKVPVGRFNDIAGNPNTSDSNTIEISYNTVVSLTAPVITQIVESNNQSIPNNGNSSEPTFVQIRGISTMPANTNIKIYNNGTWAGNTSLGANGEWQFNDYGFGVLAAGTQAVYTARAEVGGVESTDSNSYTITKTGK